jgi:DNA polymerase-3 subunit delta'
MAFTAETALSYLKGAWEHERLAHAYLITGPEIADKDAFAAKVAALVLGEPQGGGAPTLDAYAGRGLTLVQPQSKSRKIKIEQIRELEHVLHMAADGWKVGVIRDADRMGDSAENAFLKTLEEPPKRTLLLLLTGRPDLLLDTILSRCIRVPLHAEPGEPTEAEQRALTALSDFVAELKPGQDAGVSGALRLVGEFSALLRDEKEASAKTLEAEYKAEQKHYKQTTDADKWLKSREEFFKGAAEAAYLARRDTIVALLLGWIGDTVRQSQGAPRLDFPDQTADTARFASGRPTRDLLRRLAAIEDLHRNLQTTVREGLALEVALIEAFA